MKFFSGPGFTLDRRFTGETAPCMNVAEGIFVILLTEEEFKTFTPKDI